MTEHPSEQSEHAKDSDCSIDPRTDCCEVCEVYHGDPCPCCGQRGFHAEGCDALIPIG